MNFRPAFSDGLWKVVSFLFYQISHHGPVPSWWYVTRRIKHGTRTYLLLPWVNIGPSMMSYNTVCQVIDKISLNTTTFVSVKEPITDLDEKENRGIGAILILHSTLCWEITVYEDLCVNLFAMGYFSLISAILYGKCTGKTG